ncbi:MAG: porin [Pseudomonadota bacterium]
MKSILLTSTALVAFAGAAAADGHATGFSFSGDAVLGYTADSDVNTGPVGTNAIAGDRFFWELDIDVAASTELDNGLTATAEFGFEVVDENLGQDLVSSDYVLSVSGESASLSFGDLDPVAEDRFGGVDGDTTAGFNDQDAHFDVVGFESILVGEATFGSFTGAVSFGVDSGDGLLIADVEDLDALQLHIAGTVSILDVELAFQDELGAADSVFGIAASASVGGADITVSYLDDGTENSTGISVAYPFGPVTVEGYYSVNDINEDNYGIDVDYSSGPIAVNFFADVDGASDDNPDDLGEDVTEFGIEGSYDVGNGLELFAGYITTDEDDAFETTYFAATYDLGGGAEFLFSYADDGNELANVTDDEVGDPEYNEGLTVQVSFEF